VTIEHIKNYLRLTDLPEYSATISMLLTPPKSKNCTVGKSNGAKVCHKMGGQDGFNVFTSNIRGVRTQE
jgi:hypothetical protein